MTYTDALNSLFQGQKVKLPEWTGYWFMDKNNDILVFTATGDVLTTPFIEDYKNRIDWEITDDSLDFGGALKAMKAGKRVRLPYWSADVYIAIQVTTPLSKMTSDYLYVTSRFGMVPWNPTQIELLSEKWLIALVN